VSAEGSVFVELCKAATYQYANDPSAPGVHVSFLGAAGWYASVKRFTEPHGQGAFVVCNAKAATLGELFALLAKQWLAKGGIHGKLAAAVLAYENAKEFPAGSDKG
jgi:hypothetical protein